MDGLKALLDGLAHEAPPYDVLDRAEKAVRRRRRIVRLAPVAAGVAVLLVLGAGWVMLREASPAPVARPGTPATWLPQHLTVIKDPPPLPTDKGIGPAALLYFPSGGDVATGVWRIVTSDGRQYGVAATMDEPASEFLARASLSPDGRWLVVSRRRGPVLRDLTGTTERLLVEARPGHDSADIFWSPDSRQLVLVRISPDGTDRTVIAMDLTLGTQSTPSSLAAFGNPQPLGVDRAGDLVLMSGLPGPVIFWFVDPATGRERRRLTFDRHDSASPNQVDPDIFTGSLLLDGESLLVEPTRGVTVPNPEPGGPATKVTPDPSGPHELLAVDLNTGRITEHHRLPDLSTGPGTAGSQSEWRLMVTASQEAVLFVRKQPPPGGPFTDPAQLPPWPVTKALEQLDRRTGAFWVVTSITGDIERLVPRGSG